MIEITNLDGSVSRESIRVLLRLALDNNPAVTEYTEDNVLRAEEDVYRAPFKRLAYDSEKDMVVGLIVGTVTQTSVGETIAVELLLYVAPAYRKTRAAFMLMDEFERWAEHVDATSICVSHYHGDDRIGSFYKKRGYEPVEITYRKKI